MRPCKQDWVRTCADTPTKTDCELSNSGGRQNAFPAGTEDLVIQFRPSYVNSWSVSAPPEVVFAQNYLGEAHKTFRITSGAAADRYPTFTLQQLVALGGIYLDARNVLAVSQNFTGNFPTYRTTVGRCRLTPG